MSRLKMVRLVILLTFIAYIISTGSNGIIWALEPNNLWVDITPGNSLELNQQSVQWSFINNRLYIFALMNGKIAISRIDENNTFVADGSLGSPNIDLSSFQVKDIDGDNQPEVLAGTMAPGLVYLYKLNQDLQWESLDYGKYVWSSITHIVSGNFNGNNSANILIQNNEGFFYLLHKSDNSIDLIWKSPNAFRQVISSNTIDIDNDGKEEILVTYQNNSIAVLKIINNSVVSLWENYPWGKILAFAIGDWDNDGRKEVVFSTSQKMLYVLSSSDKGIFFKDQSAKFNFIIEKMFFTNMNNQAIWIATDTAGKMHVFRYQKNEKQWRESISLSIGRISQFIPLNLNSFLLWSVNQQTYFCELNDLNSYKLCVGQQILEINPNLIANDNQIYLPLRTLSIPNGNILVNEEKNDYKLIINQNCYEISKQQPFVIKQNGEVVSNSTLGFIRNHELFFPLQTYATVFNLNISVDNTQHLVVLDD